MNGKKLMALLLVLALCSGVLSACGRQLVAPDTKPAETTPGETKPTETGLAETTEPIPEVTGQRNAEFYPIDFGGTLTMATTMINGDRAHNYLLMEELTGVDIDWKVMTVDRIPQLFVGDGEMPDMFMNVGGITKSQVQEYGAEGKLVNFLDKEILNKMPNLKAAYEADPKLFDGVKDYTGAAYALPYYCHTLTMGSNLFYIRTDMTKEAGIEELPTTVEGFLEMCETLKNYYANVDGYVPMVTNGGAGVKYTGAYTTFFFPAFGEYLTPGVGITEDNSSVYAGFATEQYRRYLRFMNTCWEAGYLDPNCYTVDSRTDKQALIDRKATMNPFATYLTPDNFASGELEFQVMPPVTSQYQTEARWAMPNRYRTSTYMIASACRDLDAACAFLDALYTTEDDPIKDEDGVKAWGISLWLGEIGKITFVDKESGTYQVVSTYPDGNCFHLSSAGHGSSAYVDWPYVEDSGTGLMVKALGTRDILEPKGVFTLDASVLALNPEEQEAYNSCWNSIEQKVNEMTAAFITGGADLDTQWDAYINDLKELGLETVLGCYRNALDRYNAR